MLRDPRLPQHDPLPWQLVVCPGTVRFARVNREYQTLFRIYAIHRVRNPDYVWVGQSLTRLSQVMREHEYKFHVSSGYRIVRGKCARNVTGGLAVYGARDAADVNKILDYAWAPHIAVVLRDPDNWELRDESGDPDSDKEPWVTCKPSDSALAQPENSLVATQPQ